MVLWRTLISYGDGFLQYETTSGERPVNIVESKVRPGYGVAPTKAVISIFCPYHNALLCSADVPCLVTNTHWPLFVRLLTLHSLTDRPPLSAQLMTTVLVHLKWWSCWWIIHKVERNSPQNDHCLYNRTLRLSLTCSTVYFKELFWVHSFQYCKHWRGKRQYAWA